MRQAVLLAKELMAAQKEAGELRRQLAAATKSAADARAEAEEARLQLDAVRGPQEYLIAQIRAKDAAAKDAQTRLDALSAQLQLVQQSLAHSEASRQSVEGDLRRVVSARRDIDTLVAVVQEALAMRQIATVKGTASGSAEGAGHAGDASGMQAMLLHAATALLQSATGPSPMAADTRSHSTPARAQHASSHAHAHPRHGHNGDAASNGGSGGSISTGDLHVPSGTTSPLQSASTRTTPPHDERSERGGRFGRDITNASASAAPAPTGPHVHFAGAPAASVATTRAGGSCQPSYTARLLGPPRIVPEDHGRGVAAAGGSGRWMYAARGAGLGDSDSVEYTAEAPLMRGMHFVRAP